MTFFQSKVMCVIQARVNSKRLPGKILLDMHGRNILQRTIDTAKQIDGLSEIYVATTKSLEDDTVREIAKKESVKCIRGSVKDVRSRFLALAKKEPDSILVRITGDNPLTSPQLAELLLKEYVELRESSATPSYLAFDFQSILEGTGSEVICSPKFVEISKHSDSDFDKEHVTEKLRRRSTYSRIMPPKTLRNRTHSVTIDQQTDYEKVKNITDGLWHFPTDRIIERLLSLSVREEAEDFPAGRNHLG